MFYRKKALRLMTFSTFDEHLSPLRFKTLNMILCHIMSYLHDLVSYQIAIFMYWLKNRFSRPNFLTPPNPCEITTGNMTQHLEEAARLLSHAKATSTSVHKAKKERKKDNKK